MQVSQSWIANVARLQALLRKETWYNTFWSQFSGFVGINDDNGNKTYTPSGKPIEILTQSPEPGRDNMLIPFIKDLTGAPVYGDTTLKGTGEEMDMLWLRTYWNQVRKAVMKRTGKMDEQRAYLYKLYEQASPLLRRWFSKWENQQVFAAFYEGGSFNLTAGTNVDGLGLVKRYHPNFYVHTTATLTAIGTEKKLKTAAELTAVQEAAATADTGEDLLSQMRIKAMELRIPQIESANGDPYWLLIMSPAQIRSLKQDTGTYGVSGLRSAFQTWKMEHPEIRGVVDYYEGFAIVEDIVGVRGWGGSSSPNFFGTTTETMFAPTTVTDNACMIVVGNSAVGKAIPSGMRFTNEIDDHENTIEVGGAMITGYNRADFFAEADGGEVYGDAFYKQNASGGVADALLAVNQSSMIVMTDETA